MKETCFVDLPHYVKGSLRRHEPLAEHLLCMVQKLESSSDWSASIGFPEDVCQVFKGLSGNKAVITLHGRRKTSCLRL